jgi:hypothetical protein
MPPLLVLRMTSEHPPGRFVPRRLRADVWTPIYGRGGLVDVQFSWHEASLSS